MSINPIIEEACTHFEAAESGAKVHTDELVIRHFEALTSEISRVSKRATQAQSRIEELEIKIELLQKQNAILRDGQKAIPLAVWRHLLALCHTDGWSHRESTVWLIENRP